MFVDSKEANMERFRWRAVRAVVGSLAVIAAGCSSESGLSPAGPTPGFSADTIEIAPAGAIVGTSVTLESRIASKTRAGTSFTYYWDFGDGSTVSGGEAISHVYADAGVFVATVTASSSETGSVRATLNIPVRSLTGEWSGDYGRVSITQDGLDLRGRYLDDPRQGIVEGGVSEAGTVTFTIERPGLAPVTFTGTAGPEVMTLVGVENGRDGVDRPWKFTRY
jgi:PKD domain